MRDGSFQAVLLWDQPALDAFRIRPHRFASLMGSLSGR